MWRMGSLLPSASLSVLASDSQNPTYGSVRSHLLGTALRFRSLLHLLQRSSLQALLSLA